MDYKKGVMEKAQKYICKIFYKCTMLLYNIIVSQYNN